MQVTAAQDMLAIKEVMQVAWTMWLSRIDTPPPIMLHAGGNVAVRVPHECAREAPGEGIKFRCRKATSKSLGANTYTVPCELPESLL